MSPEAERKVLGLVGLGVRGRLAVIGVEQVRVAAQRGKLRCAVVATDASQHSQHKVLPMLAAKRIAVVEVPSAAALGHAVGRETTAAVGITDAPLARGIRAAARDGAVTQQQ